MRRNTRGFSLGNLSTVAWLIIVTVVVSLIAFIATALTSDEGSFFALNPSSAIDFFALKPSSLVNGEYLWTIFVHMFVHGNLAHLFINMFVLYSLGGLSEKIIGRVRFLRFYLIAGVFAGLLSVILALAFGDSTLGEKIFGSPEIYMVGASGAIFAIAGLYVTLLPKIRFMILFLPFFSLPAYVMVPLVLFIMWIISIVANLPVGNVAHFGGFLVGLIYGFYLRNKYKNKVTKLQRLFR